MNTPKPKQLEQRRPKQREIMPPKYRLRLDLRKHFPHMPRDAMGQIGSRRADYDARRTLEAIKASHEEGQKKGAHNGTETKTKAER